MKKMIIIVLSLVMLFGLLVGCSSRTDTPAATPSQNVPESSIDNTDHPTFEEQQPTTDTYSGDFSEFMGAIGDEPYIDLDEYAEATGYDAVQVHGTIDGLYCETSNGIFLMTVFGEECRFYSPTEEKGRYRVIQVLHTKNEATREGHEMVGICLNSTVWSCGYRVADAVKLWLKWIVETEDVTSDPFDGIHRSVFYLTNIQIGSDPDAIDLRNFEQVGGVEARD